MKIVIIGCGRVGSSMADAYDRSGHEVLVIDSLTSAFDRLPSTFGGTAIRGDGTDEDVLERAGATGADVFLALTEGDNRNVMAAQLAYEALGIEKVIAKINDPLRAKAYAELGIATLCRTGLMVDAVDRYLGLPLSNLPGMLAATGHHDQHEPIAGRRVRRSRASARRSFPTRRSFPARPRRSEPMFVLVVGGGKVGYYLAKELIESGHEVALMEKDQRRATEIADEIGSIVIAHDGCEGKYLAEAGCNRADVVAAVTGDDEDNLVICQMAKHHFDVPRTIARVNNPKNEALFRHLGVDELISPTRMILGSIEQDIPVHELLHLAALGEGELELIEAHLQSGSPAIGRAPKDLSIPDGCSLFAVIRDGIATPLRPDTVMLEGRQGHRHRQDGVPGAAPRPAHRGSRGDRGADPVGIRAPRDAAAGGPGRGGPAGRGAAGRDAAASCALPDRCTSREHWSGRSDIGRRDPSVDRAAEALDPCQMLVRRHICHRIADQRSGGEHLTETGPPRPRAHVLEMKNAQHS